MQKTNFNILPLVQVHRLKNPENVIIGQLKENSLRNKFTAVKQLITGKINVRPVSKTKISESFPNH